MFILIRYFTITQKDSIKKKKKNPFKVSVLRTESYDEKE